jgi:hypothetical protein
MTEANKTKFILIKTKDTDKRQIESAKTELRMRQNGWTQGIEKKETVPLTRGKEIVSKTGDIWENYALMHERMFDDSTIKDVNSKDEDVIEIDEFEE